MTPPLSPQAERNLVAAILFLALVLRILAAVLLPDQGQLLSDASAYRDSAGDLLKYWYVTNPVQMPLYPLLIAAAGSATGQIVTDVVLSVISVWLICALTRELFSSQPATIFAGLAAACYPPFIFFSVVGLSETIFMTLILTAFFGWYRGHFTAAAIASVLAILTRPVFEPFAPVLVLLFALVVHRFSLKQALVRLAAYGTIYIVLMTPWWLSNYAQYGRFVRLTPGGGMALYAGNNPMNHTGGGNLGVDYDLSAFNGITDPVDLDRALQIAAVNYIVDHPKRFVELAGLKFIRMWRLWPANEGYQSMSTILISIVSFVPVLLLAGMGLFLKRRMLRRLSPILLFGAGYTGVHMIIVGTIRYRLPLEPFLMVFAGAAADYILCTARSALARSAKRA